MVKDTVLDAWGKGIGAACAGAAIAENPYPFGTKLAEVWAKGWARVADISHALPGSKALAG